MEWTDTALVLHVGKFRETDLWVRLLASQQGMVTAFAFGGARSRRRFTGCLDAFNLILVRAGTSRNGAFLNMSEATLLEGPVRLRRDWRRQGMAANCIRFIEALGVPPDQAKTCFQLTRGVLGVLECEDAPPPILPLFFRFRLASEQGYAPDFTHCGRCGRPLRDVPESLFAVSEGLAFCPECSAPPGETIRLHPETLDVLAKVQEYSPDAWTGCRLDPEHTRQAARFIDAFIRRHLGLEWANGRFARIR